MNRPVEFTAVPSYVPPTGSQLITNYIAVNGAGGIINYWDDGYSFEDYVESVAPNDDIGFPMYIPPSEIPPLIVSIPYAIDRIEFSRYLINALNKGYIVLLDRYWTSNLGHQVGKIQMRKLNGEIDEEKTIQERKRFIQDLVDIELKGFGIPVESVVINLSMGSESSMKLIDRRSSFSDVLETDSSYLMNSFNNYQWLSSQFAHWLLVDCQEGNGNLKSIEDIHQRVLEELVNFTPFEGVYPGYL
jgi:thymidylate kinase